MTERKRKIPDDAFGSKYVLGEIEVPEECVACRFCGERCMEAEAVEDWYGRGLVIRIYSMCAECQDEEKDGTRTPDFELPADSVKTWNEMNTKT